MTDVEQIWADPSIKAAIICAETNRHEPLVLGGAYAGKHLFVEIVTGDIFDDLAACAGDRAIGMHDAASDQPIARRAVTCAQRPVTRRCHRRANRRAFVAERIERQKLIVFSRAQIEIVQGHARFDRTGQIGRLVFQHARHLRRRDDQVKLHDGIAHFEPCARARRSDAPTSLVREFHHRAQFFDVVRIGDDARVFIAEAILTATGLRDAVCAEGFGQLLRDRLWRDRRQSRCARTFHKIQCLE